MGYLQRIEEGAMIAPLLSHGYLSENMLISSEFDEDPLFDKMMDDNTEDELREMFFFVLHDVQFIFDIIENFDSVLSRHQGLSNEFLSSALQNFISCVFESIYL